MANPICNVTNLLKACFQGNVIDPLRRKALLVYFMAAELKGIGGTDYTTNLTGPQAGSLLQAAIALGPSLNEDTRDLYGQRYIGLYELGLARNNAVASGGTVASDINTHMNQIKCLLNVPEATLDKMLVLLACALGVGKTYPQ